MRNAVLALIAMAGAYAFSAAPAEAAVYRYCLVEGSEAGPGTCYYNTYGQCMASASGRYAYCQLNPVIAFQQQRAGQYRGYGYDDDQPLPPKKRRIYQY